MSAILSLLLLPLRAEAAGPTSSPVERLREIKKEAESISAPAEALFEEFRILKEVYQAPRDLDSVDARRDDLHRRTEKLRLRVVALLDEHRVLENRLYVETALSQVQRGPSGNGREADDIREVVDVAHAGVTLLTFRQDLRDVMSDDRELYKVVAETARARRRLNFLLGGFVGAAALAGFFVWRRMRRKADPALSGPAS